MNPTRTINRIHFSDLDPIRFEYLCASLIYKYLALKDGFNIKHFGKLGNDGGIDIQAEYYENGVKRFWSIQCKRYEKIIKSQLKSVLTDYLKNNIERPDCYVLITGCAISKKNHQFVNDFAKDNGFKEILIWDGTYIETMLYSAHPDLLFAFFGVQINHGRSITIANIERRLKLKNKVESLLIPRYADGKLRGDVVIHNAHYDIYPNIPETPGISPWFKLGYFRPYFRGISFYLSDIVYINVNLKTAKWSFCEYTTEPTEDCIKIRANRIGNIPYDNIIDFEMEGNEYHPYPHFYCEFNNFGEPYEEIWYAPIDKEKVLKLNSNFSVWLVY